MLFYVQHVWLCVLILVERSCSKEPGYVFPLKNITITKGQDVDFRCRISSPGVYLKRSWTCQSSIIFANEKNWGSDARKQLLSDKVNEYVFRLKNVEPADEGKYTCTVYSNKTYSATMYLSVNVPPDFTELTSNLEVDEGEDVMLKCISKGKPQPRITWRHLIPSSDGVRATSEFLPLGKVTRESGGQYECTADNGVSSPIRHFIQLTVNYSPELELVESESNLKVPLGRTASIECVALGVPEPKFTWHHPSGKIFDKVSSKKDYSIVNIAKENRVRSTFFISNVKAMDYGSYFCTASNRLGFSNSSFALTQKILPPTRPPPSSLVFGRVVRDKDAGRGAADPSGNKPLFSVISSLAVLLSSMGFIFL